MVDMYVLMVCDLSRTEEIASELRAIDKVQEVLIIKMSAPSPKDLEFVYSRIRHINGVKTTSTLVGYTTHTHND